MDELPIARMIQDAHAARRFAEDGAPIWREGIGDLGCYILALTERVEAQAQEIERLRSSLSVREGTIHMAVDRLEGVVEGQPTHEGNFLQRIDELRRIEADRVSPGVFQGQADSWLRRHQADQAEIERLRAESAKARELSNMQAELVERSMAEIERLKLENQDLVEILADIRAKAEELQRVMDELEATA